MERVCFRLRIRSDRVEEYRRRHAAVWPEMLREIEASGRRNYSLFLADDGELIGYYEVDSPTESDAYLAASAVAGHWEAEMSDLFESLDADGRADQDSEHLTEIFNLAGQLSNATHESEPS